VLNIIGESNSISNKEKKVNLEKLVLESYVVHDEDIDEIKESASELNLTERLNCLRISRYLDNI
jgi:hypothetical protein